MPKCFTNSLLTILFLFIYLFLIDLVWDYVPITSSGGVLIGSLVILFVSFTLASKTSNKLIGVIRG